MSKIKVYVRVRPPLPGEFETPGCFNCTELEDISGNWIRIKKEGEQIRYFARVWGPKSTQEEMFRTIGINTVNDVFEGYYGCIFVYGQTGTGKTFTLGCLTPGIEGIQPQCIRFIYEKIAKESEKYEVTVKQHYVQLYRDSVQDLLDISKDNLKIRMDEATGATIEKVTIRDVHNYDESIALIKEGDSNRAVANTKMNSASSRSHACLITEIWRKDKITGNITFGRLYLIDLAGSERASKSGVSNDAFKEMVSINKSLTTLGSCIAGLVNNEKIVSFRDSPLTRILQHSLTGHGRTSIIVTIRPDSPNMQESLCTLKFGERAQRVEAQMTPAGYRDNTNEIQEKLRQIQRVNATLDETVSAYQAWEQKLIKELEEKEKEVITQQSNVRDTVKELNEEIKKKQEEMEIEYKNNETNILSKTADEIIRLRSENASVIKEIDEKVSEAEKEYRAKLLPTRRRAHDERDALIISRRKAEQELEQVKQEETQENPYEKARQLEEKYNETIKELQQELRGCRETLFPNLNTVQEVEEKLSEYNLAFLFLQERIKKLKMKMENWNTRAIKKFIERNYEEPDKEALRLYINGSCEAAKRLKRAEEEEEENNDNDSAPPPSDEAPPTDSEDSSNSESDDTDSESDDSSYEDTDENKSNEDNENEEEKEEVGPILTNQLFNVLKKDQRMSDILENFVIYVSRGTIIHMLRSELNDKPPLVVRSYLRLNPSRDAIIIYNLNSKGEAQLNSEPILTIKIKDIENIRLGQSTPLFIKALEYSPVIPSGTQMPTTSERCSLTSLRVFEWRSLSIMIYDDTSALDIVLDNNTDYEAWTVTLHRLTSLDPYWVSPMDIRSGVGCEKLSKVEMELCEARHIPPTSFLKVKKELIENPKKNRRLYLTLFDFRSISQLDLIHAQHIFLFFIEQSYIERHSILQIRYKETQEEEEILRIERAQLHQLRINLVNMVRYYKRATETQIQRFLVSINGREEETLSKIIGTLGPQPTEEELKKLYETEIIGETSTEKLVDKIEEQINNPTKEKQEVHEEEKRSKEEPHQVIKRQRELEISVKKQVSHNQQGENGLSKTKIINNNSLSQTLPPPTSSEIMPTTRIITGGRNTELDTQEVHIDPSSG